ncbi:MAG: aspS [Candidatus Taylorbacteria bacterium]|nr:aspS [Candidatus Taylorbacteria bacterium]
MRTYIKDLELKKGEEVIIKGWIDIRRDQGKLIFFDFRDMSGKVQGVVLPGSVAKETAEKTRPEWVVEVKGKVNERPEKNRQADKQNGNIELEILEITVLNEAETLPFDIGTDTREVGEEVRMKYRYVDLRSQRMQRNLRMRSEVFSLMRNYFRDSNFTEVETPILTKSTPEGARDYLVPSRLEKGYFYALPQSPQQYKQLLMTSGIEKYFQFPKCMRDEDTRGDRQPEFTQLDVEISFATEEEVMNVTENLLIKIVTTLYPEKKIQQIPFPKIPYAEAMSKYGVDRPDLRENKEDPNLLAFCWVIDWPMFEKTDKGGWTFSHNPFSGCKKGSEADLVNKSNIENIMAAQYDIVLNGYEIGGGSIRNHRPEMLKKVFEILGYSEEDINSKFGHMLKAFTLGTPPHGGIAWGMDRLMMLLHNEASIREVIAFPKTGEGKDFMMDAPSTVSAEQLIELGITVTKKA